MIMSRKNYAIRRMTNDTPNPVKPQDHPFYVQAGSQKTQKITRKEPDPCSLFPSPRSLY